MIATDKDWRPFEPSREAGQPKRFFEARDGGCTWSVVARDREHAVQLLRDQGAEWEVYFLDELQVVGIDEALRIGEVELAEMLPQDVALKQRCHTEDERGVIPLAEAQVGDLFCSEW